MRRLLFALACAGLASLLFVAAAAAQSPLPTGNRGSLGCPQCGVWSWVDSPAPEATVSTRVFTLNGWGFECVGGKPADRVEVWYQDYNGFWKPLPQPEDALLYGFFLRPDVVKFGKTIDCPNVQLASGWALRVHGMPTGLRRVSINVWRGPYYEQHRRTYLVTP